MKLNKCLTKEEQAELANDFEFAGLSAHHYDTNELPDYIRDAMRREGVIRNAEGKFVKISACK